jgi:hypothetical protein
MSGKDSVTVSKTTLIGAAKVLTLIAFILMWYLEYVTIEEFVILSAVAQTGLSSLALVWTKDTSEKG